MQNAHLRMGSLELATSQGRNSAGAHIKLSMDRIIVEPAAERDPCARCHMFSVVGGDQDVAAIAAAIAEGSRFAAEGPEVPRVMVSMGDNARTFRSSITIPGRKHAARHLVAVSEELSLTEAGANSDAQRTILCNDATRFILYRLGVRFGLPVLPEWSEWMVAELQRRRAMTPLIGLGCHPILVNATKSSLLTLVSAGLRRGRLAISESASSVHWKLPGQFLTLEPAAAPRGAEE
jgi:hypothetical protein